MQSRHKPYFASRPSAGGEPLVSETGSDNPFSEWDASPRELRERSRVEASRLLKAAMVESDRFARNIAATLGVTERKLRQWQDPSDPVTVSLADLLRLPPKVLEHITEYCAQLVGKKLVDLPDPSADGSTSEIAREALITSAGAVAAIMDEDAAPAQVLEELRKLSGVIDRATARYVELMKRAQNVTPIRGGEGK